MDGFGDSRRSLPMVAALLVLLLGVGPAAAQTKGDVDEARERAREALARLEQLEVRLGEANLRYQEVNAELEQVALKVTRLTDQVQDYEDQVHELRTRIQERAVEAYMDGGGSLLEIVFEASSVNDLLAAQEFLQRAATQDLGAVNRLAAVRAEMERLKGELRQDQERLEVLRAEAQAARDEMQALVEEADAIYRELQAEYQDVLAQYEAEQRRRRLAALAALQGAAAGAPAAATPGFICPMPGAHFINDWGFPRSGGRTHKGTDMFAPYGTPMYAVADGSVRVRNSGLGGLSIWLVADHGTSYFYAHLSGVAISSGQRVAKGQPIGYNGDSGNARGGAPHLHFQIHPGGGAPVNPYPTLIQHC